MVTISTLFGSQDVIGRAWMMTHSGVFWHIRDRHNTVRKIISSGIITIDYVKIKDNVFDLHIKKGLTREKIKISSKGMGLQFKTIHQGGKYISVRLLIPRSRFKEKTNLLLTVRHCQPT